MAVVGLAMAAITNTDTIHPSWQDPSPAMSFPLLPPLAPLKESQTLTKQL